VQHSITSVVEPGLDQFMGLNENSCYTMGYADDIATLISRKFQNITELLQVAMSMAL
jgi:hypothetical protein